MLLVAKIFSFKINVSERITYFKDLKSQLVIFSLYFQCSTLYRQRSTECFSGFSLLDLLTVKALYSV